jgi:PhnB protein
MSIRVTFTRKEKAMKKKVASRKAATRKPKKTVQAIPKGYHAVTPYLAVRDAGLAIEFYKRAFGARQRLRMDAPGGKVAHAEVQIDDCIVMLADEFADMGFLGPRSRGGTTVNLHLYVKDVDAVVARALAAGARIVRPLKDEFYGDRVGMVEDPFGHQWYVATHKEDLSKAELRRRGEEAMKQMGGS